jgi:hypothetical protein
MLLARILPPGAMTRACLLESRGYGGEQLLGILKLVVVNVVTA